MIEVNDRVTCINAKSLYNIPTRLVEGRDYIVYGVSKTPCCGKQTVDVGVPFPNNYSGLQDCGCGATYPSKIKNWKYASRFVKKEEGKKVSAVKLTEELVISNN